jgi:tRNA-dihydrouridine synthase B
VADWIAKRVHIHDPLPAVQLEIVLNHYEDMLSHYGSAVGTRIARKHIGWYSKGLAGSAEFRAAVNRTMEAACVRQLIRSFYEPLVARPAA